MTRKQLLKTLILDFINSRMEKKLSTANEDNIPALTQKYNENVYLETIARKAAFVKMATHIVKGTHPQASGTSLFRQTDQLPQLPFFLSSHALPPDFTSDVTGHAGSLDVWAFLNIIFEGKTLLSHLENNDPDAIAALSPDPQKARDITTALLSIKDEPTPPTSHPLAKQIFWLTGDDATDDTQFHLLSPLYPSSLTQTVYEHIQYDRYSEESKGIRDARRANVWHDGESHDYPELAIQKLGSTKPQIVSLLNSKRTGINYLLPSLPPNLGSRPIKPPKNETFFDSLSRRPKITRSVSILKHFLDSNPSPNRQTRETRDYYLNTIITDFLIFSSELQALIPGWTKNDDCFLTTPEKHWLDPLSYPNSQDPLPVIIRNFGQWLNSLLSDSLPVGEIERIFWSEQLSTTIEEYKYAN